MSEFSVRYFHAALIVENEDGSFTEEMLNIYGSYRDNAGRTKNEL